MFLLDHGRHSSLVIPRGDGEVVRQEEHRVNILYDLEFVPHPRPYSAAHHSNQVVAGWLRELGVVTRGLPLLSSWSGGEEPAPGRSEGGGEGGA